MIIGKLTRGLFFFRTHRKLRLFSLIMVGLFLAEPTLAIDVNDVVTVEFSGKRTGVYTIKYKDYSLSRDVEDFSNKRSADKPHIVIVNKGAYTVDNIRVIQYCWGVRDSDPSFVTLTNHSAKRGINLSGFTQAAVFFVAEDSSGSNCTYTVRIWIKWGKTHDFKLSEKQKAVFLKGTVTDPSVSRYSGDEVSCEMDGTPCQLTDSSFVMPSNMQPWTMGSLENVHSGKCMEVAGVSPHDSANVQQYPCHYHENQLIALIPMNGKTDVYLLNFKNSGKCLEVAGYSEKNSADIQQYSCHGGTNQQFKMKWVGRNIYTLTAEHSGKVVEVSGSGKVVEVFGYSTSDSANIQQYSYHGGNSQKWQFRSFEVGLWHWPFDDSSGTMATETQASVLDVSLQGGASFTTTTANTHSFDWNALRFHGVNDYAIISNRTLGLTTLENFTVAVWIKANTKQTHTSTPNSVIEKRSYTEPYPYAIRYNHDSGTVTADRYDGTHNPSVSSVSAINDGQFHHVAFVKENETLTLYIDGVYEGRTTDTTRPTANGSSLYLGGTRNGGKSFKGVLDDLHIYNYAISEMTLQILTENAPDHPFENEVYYRIQEVMTSTAVIQMDGNDPVFLYDGTGDEWSAQWALEESDNYVRLRNREKPDHYLHIENGVLEISPISDSAQSAMWTLESVEGTSDVRIVNHEQPDQAISFGVAENVNISTLSSENRWTHWLLETDF